MSEIYVSTDIEADGPIPGPHSLLSFASAAFTEKKELVGTYQVNLELLPGAEGHPETMDWWRKNPSAWEASRKDVQPPEKAMKDYAAWLNGLPGKPVFVAYPAVYDFMFVHWYLMKFNGSSPFKHRGIDIASYAMAVLKIEYWDLGKSKVPQDWFDDLPHTHRALDDAIEQGSWFINMLNHNLNRGC